MKYIVFDLEWNQSPNGKRFSNARLPFEIIEIGAVCLDEQLHIEDTFHRLIRPTVYHWINNNIRNVTQMNMEELEKGVPFPKAARDFMRWCGNDFVFCTWGDQDVMELQRNMQFYKQLSLLPPPVLYLDVQKIFARAFETMDVRRSLEYAIDYLGILKEHGFHRALEDAHFTAEVMIRIPRRLYQPELSVDVYQHPGAQEKEWFINLPGGVTKYVSQEYVSREKAMKDREVLSIRCPLCSKNAKRTLKWFTKSGKVFYCLALCKEHGMLTGRIRVHKTPEEHAFVVKTIRAAVPSDQELIQNMYDQLLEKHNKK